MEVMKALSIASILISKVIAARAAGKETIEVDDMGSEFASVNARIRDARGPGGESPTG